MRRCIYRDATPLKAHARAGDSARECPACPARVIKHGRKEALISFPSDFRSAVALGVRVTRNPTVYRLSNNYFSSKGNEGEYDGRSAREGRSSPCAQ